MKEITIGANDAGRRLDRFLRKYLREASLGEIYKLIRKDVKVDGRRRDQAYMLAEGEVLALYLSDEAIDRLIGAGKNVYAGTGAAGSAQNRSTAGSDRGRSSRTQNHRAKRQFGIIYEDDRILIADKPYGLLTHGDSHEKKNHLANQVKDYLIERGDYDPRAERVFAPAPANRIDRNTTGIVLFGKTASALKDLNTMIREDMIDKYYMTIVAGRIDKELTLTGSLIKDERANRVTVSGIGSNGSSTRSRSGSRFSESSPAEKSGGAAHSVSTGATGDTSTEGREIITVVKPLEHFQIKIHEKAHPDSSGRSRGKTVTATLVEIRLVTGRPHQIRAHLAGIGHPVIGDSKYAAGSVSSGGHSSSNMRRNSKSGEALLLNEYAKSKFGLTTQLLHAQRLEIRETTDELAYLRGQSFEAALPSRFERILDELRKSSSD